MLNNACIRGKSPRTKHGHGVICMRPLCLLMINTLMGLELIKQAVVTVTS